MGKQETMKRRLMTIVAMSMHDAWHRRESFSLDEVTGSTLEISEAVVVAMLEELRHPTDAMIDAGVEARMRKYQEFEAQGIDTRTLLVANHPAGTIYEAMIVAALNEDSGE